MEVCPIQVFSVVSVFVTLMGNSMLKLVCVMYFVKSGNSKYRSMKLKVVVIVKILGGIIFTRGQIALGL